MHRIILILLGLFIWSTTEVVAQQTASVSGYVTDSETGETLISANIGFQGTRLGASTNTLGYYTITNIEPGTYTLVGSYIGYQSYSRQISLEPGENLRLDIGLIPESIELEEIEVRSQAELEEQKNIGTAQVNTELIKELPSVFEADVFRSVQLLPGVKAASDFSSGLYIRGGSPDQTLILLDRTTVYNPSHFFGFFSTFNPDAIKDVRLYKGGYPAEYGGRLGSVLTIYNKDGNRKETVGSATIGLLASRASVEGPYKKGSWMLAVRRSTLEPLLAGLRQSVDNIPSKFYFYDVNGKINFDANANNKFSLAFYAGQDRVTFPFTDDAVFELDYGNQTVSGNWTHIFSEKLFANTVLTGSRYFNYPDFDLAGTPFSRENNIYDFSLKSDLEYLPNNDHRLKMGFWSGIFTFKLNDIFDDRTTFQSRIQNQYASFYVQDEWRPSDRWILTPGARFNYFSDGEYIRVEPRVAVEYRPTNRIRLQGAYGRYNQFITLISNEAFSGFDVWLTSAEGVSPAYGDQFVIGAKTIPFQDYGLDIELYYRSMNDLFELDPFLPDVGGLPYQDVFRFGEGYAYGTEVFFEKRAGRFTGFLGYTLAFTWRKFPGFNAEISNQEQTARFYPPKYDRRHDINVVGNYQLNDRWKFTASFNFATGQSYTKVLGRYVQYDLPWTNEDRNAFTVGKVNASRLPNYHRLDISFSRTGRFFDLGDSELQLQLINVYSRRNTWFYNFDFNENPIEINEVNMLPILPSISYTVNF
jgi:outer membrane receptor for ferrienterochelin and colicin